MAEDIDNKQVEKEVEKGSEEAPAEVEKKEDTVKEDEETPGNDVEEMEELSDEDRKIMDRIETMTVIQLNTLVKAIEKKFGVSAQAVAAAAPNSGADDVEEKDSFTVELVGSGDKKIAMIKAIKELLGLGLKEAKDLVEGVPVTLKEGVKKDEAEEIKAKIAEAGGTVELK